MQRFRLPPGADAAAYYLTVKRLEGSSAVLRPEEKPLVVFETLAEAALDLPKVKRSSVGSISSIATNLSQHRNDTAVKISDVPGRAGLKNPGLGRPLPSL